MDDTLKEYFDHILSGITPASQKTPKSLAELIEKEEEWKKRRSERHPSTEYTPPPQMEAIDLTYEEARVTFWRLYQSILYPAKAIVHTQNKTTISALLNYMISEPCPLPSHKGLYVVGAYGSGKSKLMKALIHVPRSYPQALCRRPIWLSYRAYKKKTATGIMMETLLDEWSKHEIVIDDLGFEEDDKSTRSNVYGTLTNIVQEIVRARYESLQKYGVVTHFTSNKPITEIAELYGDGTATRLIEMTSQILWRGDNLRK
jgi:DNA replication protein DnaC